MMEEKRFIAKKVPVQEYIKSGGKKRSKRGGKAGDGKNRYRGWEGETVFCKNLRERQLSRKDWKKGSNGSGHL